MHGHAPRVRRRANDSTKFTINIVPLVNKIADALITAGTSILVAKIIQNG